MIINTTVIGFLCITLGLAFCGIRFLGAFQKLGNQRSERRIGILLSVFLFNFALVNAPLAIGSLFFVRNAEIFYVCILASNIFLMITAILGTYIVFYISFPSISPLPGMGLACLLGIALTAMTGDKPSAHSSRLTPEIIN